MLCHFVKTGNLTAKCTVCGREIRAHDPAKVYAVCSGEPRKFPPLLKQAKNYAKAVTEHVKSGMETRTDEEVIQLLEICEACDRYENGRCLVCGCRLSASKSAFSNKLRMKSQACPLGRWE